MSDWTPRMKKLVDLLKDVRREQKLIKEDEGIDVSTEEIMMAWQVLELREMNNSFFEIEEEDDDDEKDSNRIPFHPYRPEE